MALIIPNTIQNSIPADGDKLGQNFDAILNWANQDAINRDGSVGMVNPLLLSGPPTQPNQAATKGYVDAWAPVGVIWMYGGITEPAGWMFCRGQAISRATYAALFAVYSTRYGTGNGSTTFNLPDYRGRYAMGYNEGGSYGASFTPFGTKDAIVPLHDHAVEAHTHPVNITSGVENAPHTHPLGAEKVLTHNQTSGSIYLRQENVNPMRVNVLLSTTGNDSSNHGHPVVGNTGAATAHRTADAGVSVTNGNLPPTQALNFIVKVL